MGDMELIIITGLVLLLAGLIKGVVGLGLPTVTVALMTALVGFKAAIAVMLLPSLITNFWQMVTGGHFKALAKRLWLFQLLIIVGTYVGAGAIEVVDTRVLTALLGGSVLLYAAFGLLAPRLPEAGARERWLSGPMGLATGVLTGLTGSMTMPSVLYFQMLRLAKDEMVQTMGMTFFVGTLALGLGVGSRGLIPENIGPAALVGVVTALLGMRIGQMVRGKLSEAAFKRALLISLGAIGLWIIIKSVVMN